MTNPYRHCSRCGGSDLPAKGPREFVCRACGYRHFITPFPPGETGEQAAAREVAEETGLVLAPSAFRHLATLPNDYWFQDYLWPTLDLFYTAQVEGAPATQPDPEEVAEIAWLEPEQALALDFAFESNRGAVERLRVD